MKIHPENLPGASGLTTSRSQLTTPAHSSQKYSTLDVVGTGQDSAALSDLTSNISAAISADQAKTADRVSHLAALYSKGKYEVDAAGLSKALVSHALTGRVDGDAL